MNPACVALLVCLSALVGGCGDPSGVEGSLTTAYPLEIVGARARRYPHELAIEYFDRRGAVPLRVSVYVEEGKELSKGRYDLIERGDLTGRTAEGRPIPRLRAGRLHLVEYGDRDGAKVVGSADASFEIGGDTFMLTAHVETQLEWVDWPVRQAPQP